MSGCPNDSPRDADTLPARPEGGSVIVQNIKWAGNRQAG